MIFIQFKYCNIHPFLFICLLFISAGCKKVKNLEEITPTYIEGYVVNSITGDSVAGALVELWEDDKGGSVLLENFDTKLATFYTNDNGYYKFNFSCSNLKYYGIIAFKEYYTNYNTLGVFSCNKITMSINLTPFSWLKIHLKNINPFNENDSIYYHYYFSLVGDDIDTTLYRQFSSDVTQVDKWDVTKNGITTTHAAINSCTPLDTCSLNIYY